MGARDTRGTTGAVTRTSTAAVIALSLGLAGCGASADSSKEGSGASATGTAEAAGGEDWPAVEITLATVYTEDLVESQALQQVADNVEAATGGQVTFELRFGPALGSAADINELVVTGGIDMALHAQAPADEYDAFGLPYVITDYQQFDAIMDSEYEADWAERMADSTGITVVDGWGRGLRHAYFREPASAFDDLAGRKIRVPSVDSLIKTVESWDASPVSISGDELFTALSSGAVDGAENSLSQILALSHYEVAPHVLLTGHIMTPTFLMARSEWWDGLDQDVRNLLVEEFAAAADWAISQHEAAREQLVSELEELDVTITTPELDPFFEAAGFAEDAAVEVWGQQAYDEIVSLREGAS